MPDCNSGKFCKSCNKTVIDFRKSDSFELLNILKKEQEVCGMFSNEQVNLVQDIPKQTINSYKRYVIGILVSLGLTFFCKESVAQISIPDTCDTTVKSKIDQNLYFGGINEIMPQYKKGGEAMVKFIKNSINYPKDAKAGRVYVQFIIDELGNVTEPKIVRGLSEIADKEALRIVKLLEFTPGLQNGKLKNYSYTLPVFFNTEIK
ncbi:energy transducer TonB [Pedobacter alpinus]|uniref:Energy transducer TonB n=2 Tax=Pedobacter alpinus TaxID=1590643 RepID=A0ABW5TXL3_9SPHI